MNPPIADSLVLVFTFGMSLKGWRDTGMLEREWALYQQLLPHYRRLVIVTYGDVQDDAILDALVPDAGERARIHLVCNRDRSEPLIYGGAVPGLVRTALGDSRSVIVKTNQMVGGEVAVRVADHLREHGLTVGLIARGGYLWTRFVTYENGPHSDAANDAAARESLLCRAADVVVGTTAEMVEDLAWRYGLNPGQTRVVPNYVLTDDEPVPAAERDRGLMLYAGQLVTRKRVDILIEALTRLPEETRSGVRLEIHGDGPERRRLEELVQRLAVPVAFHPRIPHKQLLQRMQRCCLYLQASELEGHPKTVLEAMSTGAAVVVADSPGMSGVIQHGSTGLRVQPNPDAFAHAINELIGDEDWRELLGSAASRVVRSTVGLSTILLREIEVHQLALANAAARPMPRLKASA